mmetsp:Transcript_41873/g.47582  ORF Transcript_41873/g.47582 Transcript_41873/m.47582 type:complete len:446 (+) Transcript_41873:141-1478(+)
MGRSFLMRSISSIGGDGGGKKSGATTKKQRRDNSDEGGKVLWEDMPIDLWQDCFAYLNVSDFLHAFLVCRDFREISNSTPFWKTIYLQRYFCKHRQPSDDDNDFCYHPPVVESTKEKEEKDDNITTKEEISRKRTTHSLPSSSLSSFDGWKALYQRRIESHNKTSLSFKTDAHKLQRSQDGIWEFKNNFKVSSWLYTKMIRRNEVMKKYCCYYYSDGGQLYSNGWNYFEATVLKGGGSIGIVSEEDNYHHRRSRLFRLGRNENNNDHVGWKPVSFGYHSDDGRLYWNDGSSDSDIDYKTKPYGPKWASGGGEADHDDDDNEDDGYSTTTTSEEEENVEDDDSIQDNNDDDTAAAAEIFQIPVIGCGYNSCTQELFFTRNGKFLGYANTTTTSPDSSNKYQHLRVPSENLYVAAYTLNHAGDEVELNFGFQPFRFDIDNFLGFHCL